MHYLMVASFLLLWIHNHLATGCNSGDPNGCKNYWYHKPSQNNTADEGEFL